VGFDTANFNVTSNHFVAPVVSGQFTRSATSNLNMVKGGLDFSILGRALPPHDAVQHNGAYGGKVKDGKPVLVANDSLPSIEHREFADRHCDKGEAA